jgi:hypothetical protein
VPIVTTRFGVIIDALIALLNASPTFADPVRVYDGPAMVGDNSPDSIFVGFGGDWETPVESVGIDHGDYYVGNTTITETLVIAGEIICWTGDNAIKPVRDRAIALFAGLETVIRTDPSLGIDGSTLAHLTPSTVDQYTFEGGLACRIAYTVHVITSLKTS